MSKVFSTITDPLGLSKLLTGKTSSDLFGPKRFKKTVRNLKSIDNMKKRAKTLTKPARTVLGG